MTLQVVNAVKGIVGSLLDGRETGNCDSERVVAKYLPIRITDEKPTDLSVRIWPIVSYGVADQNKMFERGCAFQ
jgi:hypothetical protein